MHDLIFLKDGRVQLSDSAMQIPEFVDLKRYDRSENKLFFQKAINYIFFVYKVFGSDIENVSYLQNLPLSQRKLRAIKSHCQPYTLKDMEDDKRVQACINAYLEYSRTQPERLLDAFKEDLAHYISYVETIPLNYTKSVPVTVQVPGEDRFENTFVDVEIANIKERLTALSDSQTYRKTYAELEALVIKDNKVKKTRARLFEDDKVVSKINIQGFPGSEN